MAELIKEDQMLLTEAQKPPMLPHQKEGLAEMHDGCIVWGPVGTGKSRVAMAYYFKHHRRKDLYIITTAKKRDSLDWQKEAMRWRVTPDRDTSLGFGVMTVDSWNNMANYADVENAFFIFDEQRLVGKGKWVKTFLKLAKNNRWILLSATPGDTWMDYIPVFVANGFYTNKTEFIREHVVYSSFTKYPKVDRYVNVQKLVRLRSKILVKLPFDSHTIRFPHVEPVGFDADVMRRVTKDRWNPFENKPIKDVAEMFYLARKVVNSDPERLIVLDRVLEERRKLIVFYNFDYELAMLRQMKEVVPFSEWNGHKHEYIPRTDRWIYAVQYTAGSEGWNCIETDSVLFWSLTYSYKQWEQAHGRIDRMDSPYLGLHYHILLSESWIDRAIWNSLSHKRNFQESEKHLE
jgi:hypothetical protein